MIFSAMKNTENYYRELLQREFYAIVEKNPKYSLRAFANKLGVDHSLLSKILRGKRKPSQGFIRKTAPLCGMSKEEIHKLLLMLGAEKLGPESHSKTVYLDEKSINLAKNFLQSRALEVAHELEEAYQGENIYRLQVTLVPHSEK